MVYRDFKGLKISALGFGAMRLPVVGGNEGKIDAAPAKKMVEAAIEGGINYFDTAWGYHNEQSELFLGEALKPFPRESFFLATKFPGYDNGNFGKASPIFERQLKKCQTSYFDFYLCHNVNERNIDLYLDDKKWRTLSFLKQMRDEGKIAHLGFSCHGGLDVLRRFLDAYGDCMEFCQLQLNWVDWHFQNGKEKVALLKERGIPVWVMEPLRGGKLSKLSAENEAALKAMRPGTSAAEWAFRFIQSIPEVVVTLSGMSTQAQLAENIGIFAKNEPLAEAERAALLAMGDAMVGRVALPCTECRYCVSKCPKGLDIPRILSLYNERAFTEGGFIAPIGISALPKEKQPAACIACGACRKVCPQGIDIPAAMKELAEKVPV